jgi:TolB-like protein
LYSIINAESEPITGLRTGVPMDLERIISKCMAKSPKDRYQHADELIVDLRSIHPTSTSSSTASPRTTVLRGRRNRYRVLVLGIALIVVAIGAWFFLGRQSLESSPLRKKSIAVLPFSPFGRSFDDSVFADGIQDDILTQLSKISGLRVIARTSMVLYRDSKKTLRQIGDDLDVGYLLEGSTRRASGKIRITAQLIKTADEGHLWAETYDRNDADVFAVQSDIAQRIASSMATVLSSAEKASVEEVPTTNTEAYSLYLRGNYYWDYYVDSAGNEKAAELYEKATALDPTFAQAFARAAEANIALYQSWGHTLARLERITSAIDKARRLNREDPVVHWALGEYVRTCDTVGGLTDRLKMALEEYQKALKSRPNWADVHLGIGHVLVDEGALPEARESFRRYFSLSPMSLSGLRDPWSVSSWLKEWDVARKEVDDYIARRPDDSYGYYSKAYILINGFGDLEGARAVLEDGKKLPPNQYRDRTLYITTNDLWEVNYLEGKYQEALACLVESPIDDVWNCWTRYMQRGQTYVALNQRASAMACFDSALSIAGRQPRDFWRHWRTGIGLAWRGEHEKAALALDEANRLDLAWPQRTLLEEARALSALLAGDTAKALNLLEQLISRPGGVSTSWRLPEFFTVWGLRLDPVYNPLRSNPRFRALIGK